MKRCIVCGNIGKDDSVVCDVCGNPFIDMEDTSDSSENLVEVDKRMEEQLREVWAKVQDEDFAVRSGETVSAPDPISASVEAEMSMGQASAEASEALGTGAGEPGVTVLPDVENRPAVSMNAQSEPDAQIFTEAPASNGTPVSEASVFTSEAAAAQQAKAVTPNESPVPEEPVFASETAAVQQAKAFAPVEATTLEKSAFASEAANVAYSRNVVAFKGNEADDLKKEAADAASAKQGRPRRSRTGGPQIYGQEAGQGYEGAQGVIRRDVQGGHVTEYTGNSGVVQNSSAEASGSPQHSRYDSPDRRASAQNSQAQSGRVPNTQAQQNPAVNAQRMPVNGQKVPQGQQRNGVPPYAQTQNTPGNRGSIQSGSKPSGTARRIMDASKDSIKSLLFLFVAMFHTVYLVSSVAAIFMRQLNYGVTAKLLNNLPIPSQISGYVTMFQAVMSQLDKGSVLLNLALRLPDLLFCLGLWLVCILVHSSKEKMPGAGFVLLQIHVIIDMIVACVVLLVVLILSVTLVIAAWNAGTQGLIVMAAVTLIAAVIVTMAIVMYFFCYLSTIRGISRNARMGELYGKASAYVAIITVIFGLTGIIDILSGIVNMEVTGITAGVGRIGWTLLFGIWILIYRGKMKKFSE